MLLANGVIKLRSYMVISIFHFWTFGKFLVFARSPWPSLYIGQKAVRFRSRTN